MTPADELRAAAELLSTLASEATPGPWRQHDTHLGQYGHTATVLSGERNSTELRAWLPTMSQESWDETRNVWADAAYIAAVHPGVGLALAEALNYGARSYDAAVEAARRVWGDTHNEERRRFTEEKGGLPELLAVARALLGGQP